LPGTRPDYADRMLSRASPRPEPDQQAWLLRAVLVLQSPRAVFAALRDDSDEAARARQDAVMAVIGLAGVAGVLWTPVAGTLLDDPAFDNLLIAVWAFIGGGIYGVVGYFVGSALLFLGLRSAGSAGSYRRARHLLAFALAPLALSLLVVWPLRLAAFGADLFRSGGDDRGLGDAAFGALEVGFVGWSAALLVLGTRVVHGWRWDKALEGVGLAAAGPVLLAVAVWLL
jgi:Yip1-like protein